MNMEALRGLNMSMDCELSASGHSVLAEYVWIGSTGTDLHSKTKVLERVPGAVGDLPLWHCDGPCSPSGECSVVILKPRAIFDDPFRKGPHILVLCDTFDTPTVECDGVLGKMSPHPANNRDPCEKVMTAAACSEPVFSVRQQYTLLDSTQMWPIGWPARGIDSMKPGFSCGAGVGMAQGREYAESHLRACLDANVKVSGTKADSVPGQWSYTVGPCPGIQLGDQLWMSRYLLLRVSEKFNLVASMDPKPAPGDWGGSGATVKFSTRETRQEGKGWFAIQGHVNRLQERHMQHIMMYGRGNDRRLTGRNQTSELMNFTWGLESRSASIRIPHSVLVEQRGWYEDRRPASNMDPYLVTMMLVCTTLGVSLPAVSPPGGSSPSACSSDSDALSRGSSALMDELDELESFAPDTPPQNMSILCDECSSESC